jgi:hypothetical protein
MRDRIDRGPVLVDRRIHAVQLLEQRRAQRLAGIHHDEDRRGAAGRQNTDLPAPARELGQIQHGSVLADRVGVAEIQGAVERGKIVANRAKQASDEAGVALILRPSVHVRHLDAPAGKAGADRMEDLELPGGTRVAQAADFLLGFAKLLNDGLAGGRDLGAHGVGGGRLAQHGIAQRHPFGRDFLHRGDQQAADLDRIGDPAGRPIFGDRLADQAHAQRGDAEREAGHADDEQRSDAQRSLPLRQLLYNCLVFSRSSLRQN